MPPTPVQSHRDLRRLSGSTRGVDISLGGHGQCTPGVLLVLKSASPLAMRTEVQGPRWPQDTDPLWAWNNKDGTLTERPAARCRITGHPSGGAGIQGTSLGKQVPSILVHTVACIRYVPGPGQQTGVIRKPGKWQVCPQSSQIRTNDPYLGREASWRPERLNNQDGSVCLSRAALSKGHWKVLGVHKANR